MLPVCEGKLTNQLNSSSGTMNIQFTYPNQSSNSLSTKTYGASEVFGLTVMLLTVGATNPIGIYMTARDSNNYSHISLYGGTDTKPVVRIGNLQGLDPVGGIDPDDSTVTNKWGIYTYNGFFKGVIAAERGVIGSNTTVTNNWQIGDRSIWYGNSTPGASTTALVISTGTSSTNSIAGSGTSSKTWMIAAGTGFGVTNTGVMYATGANVSGTITATAGTIGSNSTAGNRWQIGDKAIYNTTNSMTSTGVGTYVGVDGIRNYKDANTFVNIQNGKITAKAVDLTGKITATEGEIGGASISNGVLQIKDANISGTISGSKITATSISADRLNITDLQAIGASIGGFAIDTTSIHTKNVAVTSNADNSIALSSADFTRTINSTSRAGLRFAIGDKFGVTGDGAIYASSATISGSITATSGTIGGWTANSSYGLYTNSKTTATSANAGILIQKDGNIYAGAYSSSTGACAFQLLADGSGRIGRYSFATNGEFTTTVSGNTAGMGNASYAFWAGAASSSAASAPFRVAYDGSAVFANATLGDPNEYHVHIDSDSLDIMNNQDVFSTFTESGLEIYTTNISADPYSATYTSIPKKVAEFGADITLGATDRSHAYLASSGFYLKNIENTTYFELREMGADNLGVSVVVDEYYGETTDPDLPMVDSTWYHFFRHQPISSEEPAVYINGTKITSGYTFRNNYIVFDEEPANTDLVRVYYKTMDIITYATFGTRVNKLLPNLSYKYAIGGNSFTVGKDIEASGDYAFGGGIETLARGYCSFAYGEGIIAQYKGTTVFGHYNDPGSDSAYYTGNNGGFYNGQVSVVGGTPYRDLFVIGNGTDDDHRSNAFVVDWDGNGTFRGNVYLNRNGYGYYLKDGAGNSYPGLRDNSANLWIGATSTAAKHHVGGTYISTGYDATNNKGYETIKISVPNSTNTDATNYNVWHSGNLNLSVDSNGNTTFPGVVKQSKPVITLTRTNNSYVDATSFARMTATQVGNLIVIYGNLRLTTSLPATTSADLIQIGTIGCSESIMQGAAVMVPSGNGQPVLIQIGTDKKISIYNYGSSAATGWIRFSATIVINN